MIGRLKGIVLDKQAPDLLLDVNGVGYELLLPLNTFFDIPEVGETITLHTHFVVREDAQQLYGFSQLEERALFRHLIKVNGVGPKMALAILSGMSTDQFVRCVRSDDLAALVKVPGVGKKTAERLLIEMRDKLDNMAEGTEENLPTASKDINAEAESALTALGYRPQDAAKMVNRVAGDNLTTAEQLIRAALKAAL
ncbi:MAG: Holliday junction branch migration protein RuvA [Porticoccaceae bacterium]